MNSLGISTERTQRTILLQQLFSLPGKWSFLSLDALLTMYRKEFGKTCKKKLWRFVHDQRQSR